MLAIERVFLTARLYRFSPRRLVLNILEAIKVGFRVKWMDEVTPKFRKSSFPVASPSTVLSASPNTPVPGAPLLQGRCSRLCWHLLLPAHADCCQGLSGATSDLSLTFLHSPLYN